MCRVTGNTITADDALAFEQLLPAQTPPPEQKSEAAEEELRTLTFSELKALIEQGKTDGIPNNRVIPDILSVRNCKLLAVPFYQILCRMINPVNPRLRSGRSLGSLLAWR